MAKEYKAAVLITGDASGAQKAIKLTEDQLKSLNDTVKKTSDTSASFKLAGGWEKDLKSITGTVTKWGAATAAAAAAAGVALVKSAIDSADATGVLAGKLGITTEALSKLQYAAKLSDVSQGALESGLRKLSTTLVAATDPASKAAQALSAIGVSASELIDLPADEQLARIGEALSRVENLSVKAALAQQLFGKSGQALLPLLAEGGDGIRRLGDEAERLGVVVSGAAAASAMEFNDNLDRLKYAAEGLGMSVAKEVLPQMQDFTQQLTELAQRKETAEGIATFISAIGTAVIWTANAISITGNAFKDFGESLAAVMNGAAIGDLDRIQAKIDEAKNGIAYLEGKQQALSGGAQVRSFTEDDKARLKAYREELAKYTQMLELSKKLEEDHAKAEAAASAVTAASTQQTTAATGAKNAAVQTTRQLTSALNSNTDAAKEAARVEAERQRRISGVIDDLRFEVAQLARNSREQAISNALRRAGASAASAEGQEIARLTGELYDHEAALKATEEATRAHEEAMRAAAQQSNPWAEALQGAVQRVDSAFVDMWKNIGSGFDSFADSLKDAFKQLLAELAHQAITRRIVIGISGALGLGGASGAFAGGNGGGGFGIGDLFGLGSLVSGTKTFLGGLKAGGLAGGLDAVFGGAGSGISAGLVSFNEGLASLSRSLGFDGLAKGFGGNALTAEMSSIGQNLVNIGGNLLGGFAGGWAGNKLGQSLFGERKTTGIGGAVGAIVGSAIPIPVLGTMIGSFLGSLAENAIGKLFGTGDLVKFGKLGITTGADVPTDGSALKTITAASGLQLSAVAKRTDKDAALGLLDAFSALDSSLTDITRSLGVTVDFAGKVLGTTSLNVDNEGAINSFGVGARLDKFNADAIKTSADDFVRQWIEEIADQLPQRVRTILGDTSKRTAEQIVKVYGFAAQLDKLLSIDVLDEVEKATQAATKTVMDAYDTQTAALIDLAQQYDGTEASMTSLTASLAEQKNVAAAVAAAYAEVSQIIDATFGNAINTIQDSLLSEADLYTKRREQIATLTDELATTVDPAKIAGLVQQIDALSMAAFNSLSEDQQQTLGQEFITFLQQAKDLAEAQVEAGRAQLAAREDAVASAIDLEVLNTAALVQQAAADTFAGAVDKFAGLIGGNAFGFNPEQLIAYLRSQGVEVNV